MGEPIKGGEIPRVLCNLEIAWNVHGVYTVVPLNQD